MNKLLLLLAVIGMIGFTACGETATEEGTEDAMEEMEEGAEMMSDATKEMVADVEASLNEDMEAISAKLAELEADASEEGQAMKAKLEGFQNDLKSVTENLQNESVEAKEMAVAKYREIQASIEETLDANEGE